MPTLLYGLTSPGEPEPGPVAGVGGAPVRALPCGTLVAIVSAVAEKPSPTLDAVRAHDAVLQHWVAGGATVAAVRFGQVFADDAACATEVRERSDRVAALLREHDGCVEMRVLVPAPRDAQPSPGAAPIGTGRAYLESLRGPRVPGGIASDPALAALVRAERVETVAVPGRAARGVAYIHLVRRVDVAAYRTAVERVAPPDARVAGPLSLHTFAEAAP